MSYLSQSRRRVLDSQKYIYLNIPIKGCENALLPSVQAASIGMSEFAYPLNPPNLVCSDCRALRKFAFSPLNMVLIHCPHKKASNYTQLSQAEQMI